MSCTHGTLRQSAAGTRGFFKQLTSHCIHSSRCLYCISIVQRLKSCHVRASKPLVILGGRAEANLTPFLSSFTLPAEMKDPGLILPWMSLFYPFLPLDVSLNSIAPFRGMLPPQLRVPPYPDMRLFLPMAGGVPAYS